MSDVRMTWPQYERGECTADGIRVYLARLPAEILAILLMRRGCVASASELADICWPDPDHAPEAPEDNIKIHILRLRRQIPDLIETNWGRGYIIHVRADRKLAA